MAASKATAPVPSIEEFLGIVIDRRSAFEAGNIGGLLDDLSDAIQRCSHAGRARPIAQKPVLPGGGVWGGALPADLVDLPLWVLVAGRPWLDPSTHAPLRLALLTTRQLLDDSLLPAPDDQTIPVPLWAALMLQEKAIARAGSSRGRGHAQWHREYRAALVDWHRYVLLRRTLATGSWGDNQRGDRNALRQVSVHLRGTAFAADDAAIEKSHARVNARLKAGDHAFYYRSTSFPLYDDLVDPSAPIIVVV